MRIFLMAVFAALSLLVIVTPGQNKSTAPRPLSNPDPAYPAEARELGYAGTVAIVIEVQKTGKVKVLRAFGPMVSCADQRDKRAETIRKSVIETAKKLIFEPATEKGKPVGQTIQLLYSFDKNGKPRETPDTVGRKLIYGALPGQAAIFPPSVIPADARPRRISGSVSVNVLVDAQGKVVAAGAIGGLPIYAETGVDAACRARFNPMIVAGTPTEFTGTLTYNFVM